MDKLPGCMPGPVLTANLHNELVVLLLLPVKGLARRGQGTRGPTQVEHLCRAQDPELKVLIER